MQPRFHRLALWGRPLVTVYAAKASWPTVGAAAGAGLSHGGLRFFQPRSNRPAWPLPHRQKVYAVRRRYALGTRALWARNDPRRARLRDYFPSLPPWPPKAVIERAKVHSTHSFGGRLAHEGSSLSATGVRPRLLQTHCAGGPNGSGGLSVLGT